MKSKFRNWLSLEAEIDSKNRDIGFLMFLVDLTKAFLRGLLASLSSPVVPQAALDIFPNFYDFFGGEYNNI
ncbi:hypothetical protein ES332_D11G282200v1 [Gossypium tomentosum]|uniref:Uncharacterized protein n=1 Tax=Gossypium tomentosum TaxID=34277 RepID=A0A5D2IUE7_GOSTO|nr:hypothetical protein ES332_D11G282200v1 [Gossypium tomentosum]